MMTRWIARAARRADDRYEDDEPRPRRRPPEEDDDRHAAASRMTGFANQAHRRERREHGEMHQVIIILGNSEL